MIRPRSLSRVETRLLIDGTPVSATLFDMVIYAFHNYKALVSAGQNCYFYIGKIQNMEEAQWYDEVLSSLEA